MKLNSYKIVNRTETRNGVKHSWYRLESSPTEPMPGRKKAPRPDRTPAPTPSSSSPAQTLSLFPEMPPAASQQRAVWRDPELDGVKNGSVKHG